MNSQLKQANKIDIGCTAIQISHASNVLGLFQTTLSKLSEASNLPIRVVCGDQDKYIIRQQLKEMNCQSEVFMDEDLSNEGPSIVITFQS